MKPRTVLVAGLSALALATGVGVAHATQSSGPVALVYRGPASCSGCSEAVAALLEKSKWGFQVRYVGANEVTPATLAGAALYAQPGGDSVDSASKELSGAIPAVRDWVAGGGHYLGFCLGAYLEGKPGFDLLPSGTDAYISSPYSTVSTTKDVYVDVNWRGTWRQVAFQDGNLFNPPSSQGMTFGANPDGTTVIAAYPNNTIAVMVTRDGKGKVGGSGPHPEADGSWVPGQSDPDGTDYELGFDLIDTLMAP